MNPDLVNIEDVFDQFVAGQINEKAAFKLISDFVIQLVDADYLSTWIVDAKSHYENDLRKAIPVHAIFATRTAGNQERHLWNYSELLKTYQKGRNFYFHSADECKNLLLKGKKPLAGAYSIIYTYRDKPVGGILFFRYDREIDDGVISRIFYYQAIMVLLFRSLINKNRIKQLAIDEVHYKKDYNDLKQQLLTELRNNEKELHAQTSRTRELNQMLTSVNEKLQDAGRLAKIGGWDYQPDDQEFSWTPETYQLHGLPEGTNIKLQQVIGLINPAYRQSFNHALQNLVENGIHFDLQVKITIENSERWLRVIGKIKKVNNKTRYYGLYQDNHESVMDQERIADLTHLYDTVPEPLAIIDYRGYLSDINKAFIDITGYEKNELAGSHFTDFFHPDDKKKSRSEFDNLIEGKTNRFKGTYRFSCKNGDSRWFSWSAKKDDEKLKVFAVAKDLTVTNLVRKIASENEQIYQSIAHNFPFGTITIIDTKGKIIFTEGKGYEKSSIQPSMLIGKSIIEVSEDGFKAEYQKIISYVLKGETKTFEMNTQGRFVLYIISPVLEEYHEQMKIMILALDITERKQAEDALKRSQEQYKNLVQSSPFGIITLLEEQTIYANPESVKIFGFKDHLEFLSHKLEEFAVEPVQFKNMVSPDQDDGADLLQQPFRRKDGTQVLLEVRKVKIWLQEKTALQLIIQDITAQSLVEKENTQLQHILQQSVNEMYVFDSDTLKFLFVNQSALNNLRYDREDLFNLTPIDLKPEMTGQEFKRYTNPLLRGTRSKMLFETMHQRADGTVYPVEVKLELVQWKTKSAFLAIINDISEIKKQRDQNHQIQKNLSFVQKVARLGGWEYDSRDQQVVLSSELLEIFGMYSRPLVSRKWTLNQFNTTFIHPAEQQDFLAFIATLPEQPEKDFIAKKELKGSHRSGADIIIEIIVVPKDDHCWLGVIQDITQKFQTNIQLKNSESNLKALFDSTTQQFILMDREMRLINFNKLANQLMQEVIGTSIEKGEVYLNYFTDSHKQIFRKRFQQALRNEKLRYESKIPLKDKYQYFSVQLLPVKNESGEIYAVALVSEDITASKKQEEKIMLLNERLRFASEIGNVGWWEWDYPSGRVIFDDKKVTMLDRNPADFNHVNDFLAVIHPDDYEKAVQSMKDHFMGKSEAYEIIYRLQKKDGTYRWLFDKGFVTMRAKDGTPVTIKGAIFDIHDLKTSQEILKQQNAELIKANSELDNFVYRISHDLRAPLASALGLITLTRQDDNLETIRQYLELQEKSLNRMDSFIRDIIDFSRNIRMEPNYESVDIHQMIIEIFDSLDNLPNLNQVKKRIDLDGICCIEGDVMRLNIILNNLISNAVKYSFKDNPEAYVEVKLREEAQQYVLCVSDNGIGISEKHVDRIFEMFYRATDHNPGEGIGLYIVKDSVEKLKGNIQVDSQLGVGTTFTLWLPRKAPAAINAEVMLQNLQN